MIQDVKLETIPDGWRISISIKDREQPVVMVIDREDDLQDLMVTLVQYSGRFLDIQQDMAAGL